MALEAPNYFDFAEFERMRTPSRPYDPNADYSRIIAELKASCREFGYGGISPQNLVAPASLEPAIVIPYYDKSVRAFVAPQIVEASGSRAQVEGCANIRFVMNGKKFAPGVVVRRPRRIVLSHVVEGRRVTTTYRDRRPSRNLNISAVGVICHEIDHIHGKLLSDIARARLLELRERYVDGVSDIPQREEVLRAYTDLTSPCVLVRDGDAYSLRLASEFEDDIPPVSPDVLFADYFYRRFADLSRMFVPREGELLPIIPSERFLALMIRS